MKRAVPFLLSLLLAVISIGTLRAQNDGQADLDRAQDEQIGADEPDDIKKVIELCESALSKGLDEPNTDFAKRLLVSALWKHASLHATRIFDQRPPHRQWPAMRTIAVADLEKALEHNDQFSDAYMMLAKLYSLPGGDREKAKSAIDKAIELYAENDRKRSEALLSRAELQKDTEDQIADLDAAIEADATYAEAWKTRARFHIQDGQIDEAVRDFESLLKNDSTNVAIHQALAETLSSIERYGSALEHLDKAIELAPDHSLNYTLRSRIHQQQEEPKKAIADLNKALELQPNDRLALLSRARLHYLVEDIPNARADIDRVLAENPTLPEGIYLRSMIAAGENRFREAITDLQLILDADPSNTDLKLHLASFLIADQRPSKAIKLLTSIIGEEKENWRALRTRADALLSVGKHAEAIEDYTAALEMEPENDGILNNLAWVLATSPKDEVRDGTRAVVMATKACEVTEYKRAHILSTLAAAYAEAGDFEQAIKWSSEAVEKGKTDLKDQLEQLQQELDSYKERKPWRELQEIKDRPDPPRRVIET